MAAEDGLRSARQLKFCHGMLVSSGMSRVAVFDKSVQSQIFQIVQLNVVECSEVNYIYLTLLSN